VFLLAALHGGAAAQSKEVDFDIAAADGARLRATYYSPGTPGPGILLLHQCNMDRKGWKSLALALSQRGVHVLTFDYRGYGETKAPGSREKLPTDIDAALTNLISQPGVDKTRLAAGGASCGVENSIQLARRSGQIKALIFLTGPASQAGLAFLQEHRKIPIYGADTPEGFMKPLIETSTHPASTRREVAKGLHGVPMFEAEPTLPATMAEWLVQVLR
jgi:pimeloyl-ACP methyl ester carboxylesterase